jgi:hypothetical protein
VLLDLRTLPAQNDDKGNIVKEISSGSQIGIKDSASDTVQPAIGIAIEIHPNDVR